MYLIQNKRAFTLIEMLIVLFCISLIGLFGIQMNKSYMFTIKGDLFADTIKSALVLAQQEAIISGEDVGLAIDMVHKQILSTRKVSKAISIPEEIVGETMQYTFKGYTGIVTQFKNYSFKISHLLYTIKMQFGRGVFWIEKRTNM